MNSSTPYVTILMPAYNVADYIRDAIDSVLAQTFSDFEFLIINDGSKDQTEAIIKSYTDPRIRLFSQENRGVVGALNQGLQLAAGNYIARFDADDICLPDRLQRQVDFFKAHPDYVLTGGEAEYMDEQGNFIFLFTCRDYTDEDLKKRGFGSCPFIHSSVMYRKDAVIQAGGYDRDAITFEDHLLWRKLSAFGKMSNMPGPLIKVRFNPDSVTIDEKWRGKDFQHLKRRSIEQGYLTAEDTTVLKDILGKQNFARYKKAAYYSMIGKKYLWNRYQPESARANLRKAIAAMPGKVEPYVLYLLSFLPEQWIKALYRSVKSNA